MPSLLDMTDVPMTNILEQCDFKSLLKLRKVCHGLRNFIDEANFRTDLEKINIEFRRVLPPFSTGNMGRCRVSLNSKSTYIRKCEHMTPNELTTILNLQNSKIRKLKIRYRDEFGEYYMRLEKECPPETLFENFGTFNPLEEILKNKPRPLQTEKVEIVVSSGSQVMQVLPYLDPKVLKKISIPRYDLKPKNSDGIDKILELDQFKNATELRINSLTVNGDLKKFFHFEKIQVELQAIPLEDFIALKEAFTTSTHMKEFWLPGYNLNKAQFERAFGAPSNDTELQENRIRPLTGKWFFKIQNSKDEVLEIYYGSNGIRFKRIKAADVEENAVVRD